MTFSKSIVAMAWLVTAMLAALVQPTLAHAVLLSVSPADGTVLEVAPAEVVLTFNEPVAPISAQLITQGAPDTPITPRSEGSAVHLPMPADLPVGTHLVSYRVVSTDGHPIGGSLVFSVGEASAAPVAQAADASVVVAIIAVRAALYAAMMFGVGALVFLAFGPLPGGAQRLAVSLSGLGLVLAPLALALQGLDALGHPLAELFTTDAVAAGMATSYGATIVALLLAFALAIAALVSRGEVQGFTGVLALVAAAIAPALSGHASAADPQWLTRPAVAGHAASLLFWLGSLVPLALTLRRQNAVSDDALARFSASIPFAVGLLLVSGIALSVVQLGAPGPAWWTPYAGILAAKLGLVALLLAIAAWNRMRLTRPVLAGEVEPRARLRRSIVVEVGVALLILTLVAFWRVTPPPRALAAQEAAVSAATQAVAEPVMLMDDRAMVMLTVAPGRAGPVSLGLDVTSVEGAPLSPESVTVLLAQPERGIEPISRTAEQTGDTWAVDGLVLPAGAWSVTVEVRIDSFTLAKPAGGFTLAP